VGKSGDEKAVPNLIFNLSDNLKKRYLISYLAGDGYPTPVWIKHLVNNTVPSKDERSKILSC